MTNIKKECWDCERKFRILVKYRNLPLCRACFKKRSKKKWEEKLKEMEK